MCPLKIIDNSLGYFFCIFYGRIFEMFTAAITISLMAVQFTFYNIMSI